MSRESNPALRLDRILELAQRAALAPSDKILSGYRSPALAVETKPDNSPVTAFDREAEQHIREILRSDPEIQWPVLGEEFGGDTAGSPYRWVVDPIDGTMPFSRGLPYFGTLVAFEETGAQVAGGAAPPGADKPTGSVPIGDHRALVGAINLPPFSELYCAARGMGARCNGSPIHVSPHRALADCVVSAPEIQRFRVAQLEEGYERLGTVVRYFRGNGDCWMHAMAARGAIDAVVEFSLNRWDIAATEVIVEEAGGRFYKRASRSVQGKYDVVFGSPAAADEIVRLLEFTPD
jgi:histidinol-phosphatase